jgi:hypothetical protein
LSAEQTATVLDGRKKLTAWSNATALMTMNLQDEEETKRVRGAAGGAQP